MDSTTKQGAVPLNRRLQQAAKEVRMLLHHHHVGRLLCTSSNSDLSNRTLLPFSQINRGSATFTGAVEALLDSFPPHLRFAFVFHLPSLPLRFCPCVFIIYLYSHCSSSIRIHVPYLVSLHFILLSFHSLVYQNY
ncbi:hypothetical protein PIB30_035213 [Stylosanthes scabra]|uniref:Uncharacterized protein n=1 Tax=Stylosanthes scabra TaxID=79078 RepID=A0ABU6SDB7_9FABA|nr:hypothetical protein [Stylosanthes scabra]